MSNAPAPQVHRRPSFSLVWVVPIVAAVAAAWMLLREERNRGPEVVIEFADGSGVEAGKTTLEYSGVAVGVVKSVKLTEDLSHVEVRLRIYREAEKLAVEGSQFWLVRPEFSTSGVKGLDTIVRGVRLNVQPGKGAPATHFRGLAEAPASEKAGAGRAFILRTKHLGGIAVGTNLAYRDVKIGTVEETQLSEDAASVVIRVRIHPAYVELVRANTKFSNAGLTVKGGIFSGFELKNVSVESLLASGISIVTPDGPLAPAALEGMEFPLNEEAPKDSDKWSPRIPLDGKTLPSASSMTKPTPADAAAAAGALTGKQ